MKQNLIRIITGLVIIAIGGGALLSALNLFPFWETLRNWWAVLIIFGGILALIGDFRRNYIWGLLLIVVGGLLLARSQDVIDFNVFSLIVPIIIIAVGLTVALGSLKPKAKLAEKGVDTDDISAIFSGSDTVNSSNNYQGGRANALFGGITIDLRGATIKKQATLDITCLFGGVELRVPREWRVVSKVTPIIGGVENKSNSDEKHEGPVLVITGVCAFGGIEIK